MLLALAVLVAASTVARPVTSAAVPVQGPVGTYRNPIIGSDFPDPFVLADDGTYFAYATNAFAGNLQVISSIDLKHWVLHHDALPKLPPWAAGGYTWAPAVIKVSRTSYVLYYAAHARGRNESCIGRAHATTPVGPFTDDSPGPLVCPDGLQRGAIDPSPFRDGYGRPWLLWKSEGTPGREPTRIWSRPLRYDGLDFEGPSFELLHTDQAWEGSTIENPSMTWAGGKLLLFYSGAHWDDGSYAINWAHCAGMGGPCTKNLGPWVSSTRDVAGPGGQEFFRTTDGKLWMAYHAWSSSAIGYAHGGARSLRIDRVTSNANHDPVLWGPTSTAVPF